MRQVADAGNEPVVFRRAEPFRAAAEGFPEILQRHAEIRWRGVIIGEQAGGVPEKVGARGYEAVALRAGHRVAAYERIAAFREDGREIAVRRGFHGADIGDEAVLRQTRGNRRSEKSGHRADRHREDNEIRA